MGGNECRLIHLVASVYGNLVKPKESKFTYTPTMRYITDLNYVLTMQGHWDCTTHHMAEKDHHVACRLQRFQLVDKDQNGPR